jgi:hypothetical protein
LEEEKRCQNEGLENFGFYLQIKGNAARFCAKNRTVFFLQKKKKKYEKSA